MVMTILKNKKKKRHFLVANDKEKIKYAETQKKEIGPANLWLYENVMEK